MESGLMAVDCIGRQAGSWSYIQGSTRIHENEGKMNNPGGILYSVYAVLGVCCTRCMLYSVYAVLGVCCTRCMLYSVYAVLGVCCTRCMLYSVYAVLSVNSWSCHGRDRAQWLNFLFCNDCGVVNEEERDGDEVENDVEDTSGCD